MSRATRHALEHTHPGGDRPHSHADAIGSVEDVRAGAGRPNTSSPEDIDRTIRLREEELQAHKELGVVGGVLFRKEVIREPRTIDVPIVRQGVLIEHYPSDRRLSALPIGTNEVIRAPVLEEQVTIEKRPVVTEQVRVGKNAVQDRRRITETVHREEVVLDTEGSLGVNKGAAHVNTRR